jgi:hypothetical protein
MKVDGRYRFCPCKLKEWMEKHFNGKTFGGQSKQKHSLDQPQEKDHGGQANYSIRQAG